MLTIILPFPLILILSKQETISKLTLSSACDVNKIKTMNIKVTLRPVFRVSTWLQVNLEDSFQMQSQKLNRGRSQPIEQKFKIVNSKQAYITKLCGSKELNFGE